MGGKVMIDDLAKQAGIPLDSFETVRVGMNVTAAILRGDIDTGVGFTNFQRIELEELSAEDAGMLRIDELNDLGCCCFCSVQYVANGDYFEKNPEKISGFMRAMRRATDFTIEHPDAAWKIMTRANPRLDNNLYAKIYQRTLPYFSRNLLNVDRDWEKVGQFCKHLGVLETEFDQHRRRRVEVQREDDQAGGGAQLDALSPCEFILTMMPEPTLPVRGRLRSTTVST